MNVIYKQSALKNNKLCKVSQFSEGFLTLVNNKFLGKFDKEFLNKIITNQINN